MTVMRTGEALARFGRAAVRQALVSGRWQRPVRGVIVTHNGPLSLLEWDLVRLCACPPESALAGLSALHLDGFVSDNTDIVLPEGARRPELEGLIPHWSTELSELDVHPSREPRRTRPARSVVDAAAWSHHDRYAIAIVLAAFQQRLVNDQLMFEALTRRGPIRRRAMIRESVFDAVGGIHSLPERDFDEIRCSAGLPRPSRQRPVQRPDGRFYLDVSWDEFQIAAEVHGVPHIRVKRWSEDILRANEVIIAGPRLVAFTSYAIRHQKSVVADQLIRLLRSAGWTGLAAA